MKTALSKLNRSPYQRAANQMKRETMRYLERQRRLLLERRLMTIAQNQR